MLYTDITFLNRIAYNLPGFVQKNEYLWNCRCIICGDSEKHKNRMRGFFFRIDNSLAYKCHNCSVTLSFGNFLKNHIGRAIYDEYMLEKWQEKRVPTKTPPKAPKITRRLPKGDPLKGICVRLDALPADDPVVAYARGRQIPTEAFSRLYKIPQTKDIVQLAPRYEERFTTDEPRLLFPMIGTDGDLVGVGMRAIDDAHKRYYNLRIEEDGPHLFFGLDKVDTSKRVYVVEGAFDSLFLPNSIACNTADFTKTYSLDIEDAVWIFDNQPRNYEVCKTISRAIKSGERVVIWPSHVTEKDINDMVLAVRDPLSIITNNIFDGPLAQLRFNEWKKVQL